MERIGKIIFCGLAALAVPVVVAKQIGKLQTDRDHGSFVVQSFATGPTSVANVQAVQCAISGDVFSVVIEGVNTERCRVITNPSSGQII